MIFNQTLFNQIPEKMKSLNLITVILLLICSVKAFSQDCHTPDSSPPISTQGGSDCALEINYTPDQSDAFQNTPLLIFKLNFHFF